MSRLNGGTASFLTVLAFSGTVASTVQCVDGVVCNGVEIMAPHELDDLDTNEWYQRTALAVDAISLAGEVAAAATTLKMVMVLKSSTRQSTVSILKGLSRTERKGLVEDLIRKHNPGISNKQLKALVRSGHYPKRTLLGQASHAMRIALMDAAGAAFTFTGSAMSGIIKRGFVIGFGEAVDTY